MIPTGARGLARNAALNLLGQGLPLLAALPAIPLLVHGAGTERFGLLTIAWVFVGYVGLFDFGVGRALTHAVADRVGQGRPAEVPPAVRVGVRIAGVLSVFVGGLVALGAPWLAGALRLEEPLATEAVLTLRLIGVAVPVVVLGAVLRGVLEGLHRFGVVNAVRIPMGVATFIAPLSVLPWTSHLGALVGTLLVARLLGWIGYAWAVRRALSGPEFEGGSSGAGSVGGLLRYGGWATVSNLVSPLMVQFDRVAIGALLTASAVAFYTTPFEVAHRLLIIPGALVAVFFPAFAQSWASRSGEVDLLFRSSVQGILLLIVPPTLLLFSFAHEGLALWVGEEFAVAGGDVARWLLLGMTVNAGAHVPFVLLQAVGRPDVSARIHLLELPIYGAALLWALPRYGILGAAVVWAGRAVLDLVLLTAASSRIVPAIRREVVRLVPVVLLGVAAVALPVLLTEPVVRLGWVGVVFLLAAIIGMTWGWRALGRAVQ